ncbi:hypothetical protein [Pseudoalteromonas ardens]|uniref:Uncharacterized protein n=1 Tax=Pseudoalteromonas rubra TaxID=43658 RepID=A0A0L0EPB3_9GAMM|nr:hypothetical protein [Pseudoalteromonas sp. R96]KNC66322.1 hypothetical protein AC626_17685 [Pseudoalteromonas rubra]MDK1312798.1 hypothetical protein [Pseudoalteromonas sp. R96]
MGLIEKHWIKIPAILYVVGFIVHNAYLSNFGSYEFQLVQAKYILSGFGAVGFSVICIVYTGIKVNVSNVSESLTLDKVLPWSLRVISLPYVIYEILYGKELFEIGGNAKDSLILMGGVASLIAHSVVACTILDITLMAGENEYRLKKALSFLSRLLSIPMLIFTLVIAWNIPEFSGVMKATTYFFFGYVAIALSQNDKGEIELRYTNPDIKERYDKLYQAAFSIVGVFFILWTIASYYTKYIYPKIPVALGGAKLEFVSINTKEKVYDSYLIQETKDWVMYIDKSSGQVEKIKTSLIEKIVFKEEVPNQPLRQKE